MADDNTARYRPNESFGRGPAPPAADPLAELARLIGQNDPFSEYGRDARPAAQAPQPAPDHGAHYAPILPAAPQFREPSEPYAQQQPYAQQPYAPEPAAYEPAPPYAPDTP